MQQYQEQIHTQSEIKKGNGNCDDGCVLECKPTGKHEIRGRGIPMTN